MAVPSSQEPRKKPKRASRDDLPLTFLPHKNRPARIAYVSALVGLIPVVGLVLGPLAVFQGWRGIRAGRQEASGNGLGHSVVSVVLGSLETVANVIGLSLIVRGLGWV